MQISRDKKNVTIYIGEYYATREPSVITTFLGSCVAVCLHDPKNRIGGMNHILMTGRASLGTCNAPARYGINAMEILINSMMKLGAARADMVAKVFGGANVMPHFPRKNSVGSRISEFVLRFLERENIKIAGQDLGGHKSRKVFFHTDSGIAYLRKTDSMKSHMILEMEKKSMNIVSEDMKKEGDIILFGD